MGVLTNATTSFYAAYLAKSLDDLRGEIGSPILGKPMLHGVQHRRDIGFDSEPRCTIVAAQGRRIDPRSLYRQNVSLVTT